MSGATRTTFLPKEDRLRLAADPAIGAGNFIHYAVRTNPNRDEPLIWLDRPFRSLAGEVYETFSLSDLKKVVDQYAAFYYGMGVRAKDPITIFVDEGVENFIHLMALTALGAIAVMINGNQKPEMVAEGMRRAGTLGAFLGASREAAVRPHLGPGDLERLRFVATPASAATAPRGKLPARYPYEHAADDVCYLCHSSGTTGIPKPVIMSHAQHFVGSRRRLGLPDFNESERILSMMPHSHAVGINHFIFAVVSGTPFAVVSDPSAEAVLSAIQKFRPTMVLGFPRTYADLASAGMGAHDVSSVERWFSTADSSHEKHIRVIVQHGSHLENGKRVPGSTFIDMLGSTEMAFPVFQKAHTKDSNSYGRSVGKPNPIVEAAVLDEDGTPLGPNVVGRLGVKSPATTIGYWNDSLATCRRRLKGYWLMDDLGYRDAEGVYYHVDRVGEEIKTRRGNVYTLPTEEVIMQCHDEVLDTIVVGMQIDDEYAEPVAIAQVKPESALTEGALLELFNERLQKRDLSPLARVVVARSNDDWPVGATGKVLKRRLRERFDARRAPGSAGDRAATPSK
jgi:long-chain acyl-CoA synthetase